MLPVSDPGYVDLVVTVARRDASIARVLREICALDASVRGSALQIVAAHLRAHGGAEDILQCVAALADDDVARRIAEALGPLP